MNMLIAWPLWRARGPRFLMLLILVWISLRAAALWPDPADVMPMLERSARLQWEIAGLDPTPFVAAALATTTQQRGLERSPGDDAAEHALFVGGGIRADLPSPALPNSLWMGSDRHRWRHAMLAALVPPSALTPAALAQGNRPISFPPGTGAVPAMPVWPTLPNKHWSLTAYSYWRAGSGAPSTLAANRPAMLGGSQSAVRLDYALDASHRLRAFARVTATPQSGGEADLAVGMTARPFRAVPIDIHIEQRLPLVGAAQSRTLAYVSGGVDDQPLPHGFRLSAYAQGGVAGADPVEGFVDGAIAVQRPVLEQRGVRLSVGAMLAGAAQSGAQRVDAGPRATLHLPKLGQGVRIALDWRERVAGDARPPSGLALTLAAGF